MCASSRPRYEDEINKRTAAENEFVGLKKVSGLGWAGQGSPSGHSHHGERAEPALGHREPMPRVGLTFGNEVFAEGSGSDALLVEKTYCTMNDELISEANY